LTGDTGAKAAPAVKVVASKTTARVKRMVYSYCLSNRLPFGQIVAGDA
jgi:hypothetical protein